MSTASNPLITAEKLMSLPEVGMRYELVRGHLRTKPLLGMQHGAISADLRIRLGRHAVDHAQGVVFGADLGFLIARNPDTVLTSNAAFVRERPLARPCGDDYYPGAPDLAVEVVSPHDRLDEVEEKVQDWLQAGCHEVWVVSPRLKAITVHRSPTDIRVLTAQDTLESPDLLPGFACRVAEVFGG